MSRDQPFDLTSVDVSGLYSYWNYGWNNTVTITGFNAQGAQVASQSLSVGYGPTHLSL